MAKVSLKRKCSGCQQTFATPSAFLKHLDKGRCRPVTHFHVYGLFVNNKGAWELRGTEHGQ
jgi:hypothetical protein